MAQQLSFFDRRKTIQERFEKFHAAHPDVFKLFRKLAEDLRGKGHQRYSADAILHVIRWHYATTSREAPKIGNDYTSRYARLLIEQDPSWGAFFELRELKRT